MSGPSLLYKQFPQKAADMLQRSIANLLPHLPPSLVWIFSKKYIAGATLDDAVRVSKTLNAEGCSVTIDLLGEFINNLQQAELNANAYLQIVDRFGNEGINGNFSVKPTSFGLLIDEEACYGFVRSIVERAASRKGFVRIDMEDSKCVDREIKLYRRLKANFGTSVGLVLQAYLRRTGNDIDAMCDMHFAEAPLNFRLCKGIYIESESIAYKSKDEIRQQYLKHLETLLQMGAKVAVATHDEVLVDAAMELGHKYGVANSDFEFQMLYGVTPKLRRSIAAKGYRMRIYVPYGKDWFGYATRRLKENPNMVWHIVKSLFIWR
jgi:proline dehydrogenase